MAKLRHQFRCTKRSSWLVLAAASLVGCASTSHYERRANGSLELVIPRGATFISLDGGACLGSCSDFGIHLLSDGTVYFEGRSHTLVHEVVVQRVRRTNYQRLRRFLDEHHAFEWVDGGVCLTDSPSFRLAAVDSTGKRSAFLDSGCVQQNDRIWSIVAEIIRLTESGGLIR